MEKLNLDILITIAAFIVPGYITLQISNGIKPLNKDEKENTFNFLIYCVIYSFINTYLYYLISNIEVIKNLNSDLVILIISILMGFVISVANPFKLICALLAMLNIDIKSPMPTAWDYVLLNHENTNIIITLDDNTKIKAWWGKNSHASDLDHGSDMYLEKVYKENEKGEWVEDKDSKGIYLSKNIIRMIEFK